MAMQKLSLNFWTGFLILMSLLLVASGFSALPYGFAVPLLGVGGLIGVRCVTGAWPKPDWPLYGWVIALGVLGAASSLWAVTPDDTLERSLKVSAVLLLSLPLIDVIRAYPEETLRKCGSVIPLATIAAGIFPLVELYFQIPLNIFIPQESYSTILWGSIFNKSVSVFIMLLPPALLIAHKLRTHTISVILLAMTALIALVTESQASQLALIVIPLAWFSFFILPVAGTYLLSASVTIIMLLIPWLSPLAFDLFAADLSQDQSLAKQASVSMRLENWDFISRKIMEQPWTGFGMDATRSITDFESQKLYFRTSTIMHPHNLALQLWIEFGLPGILLMLGFFAFLLRRLLKLPAGERRVPFTLFCVVLTFLMVSWSIWSSWLLGFVVYLAAIMILALRTNSDPSTS